MLKKAIENSGGLRITPTIQAKNLPRSMMRCMPLRRVPQAFLAVALLLSMDGDRRPASSGRQATLGDWLWLGTVRGIAPSRPFARLYRTGSERRGNCPSRAKGLSRFGFEAGDALESPLLGGQYDSSSAWRFWNTSNATEIS